VHGTGSHGCVQLALSQLLGWLVCTVYPAQSFKCVDVKKKKSFKCVTTNNSPIPVHAYSLWLDIWSVY
jgi:hypothetical protein